MKFYLITRLEYICWKIQFWMSYHKPYYPVWLRVRLLKLYPDTRWHMNKFIYSRWIEMGWKPRKEFFPLPWYIGDSCLGPLIIPWNAVERWFRKHTGGRSHRCEFTDLKRGALHGGKDGGYMNEYFEKFLENISDEMEGEE